MWIKIFPLKPIEIAFLLIWLYGSFYLQNWYLLPIFLVYLLWIVVSRGLKLGVRLVLTLLPFALFFSFLNWKAALSYHSAPKELTQITMLVDTIKVNGDSLSFRGQNSGRTYQVYYQLQSEEEQDYFKRLDQTVLLMVEAKTQEAERRRNFSGFDYRAYLKSQKIYRTLKVSKIKSIHKTSKWNIRWQIAQWRRQLLVFIETHFPAPMRHYMTGLLLGYLDVSFDEMEDLYSNLGIIHLFALSGMQVGFFMNRVRYVILRLGVTQEHSFWLQIPLSFLYAGLTGYSISVIRSLLQLILSLMGYKKLDNFALTIILLMLILPNALASTGAVLSLAYAFILTIMDWEHLKGVKKLLAEVMTISLGILPLLMWYFASFQPLSIILTALFALVFDFLILPLLSMVLLLSPLFVMDWWNPCFEWLEVVIRLVDNYSPKPLILGTPMLIVGAGMLFFLALWHDFYFVKSLRRLSICCLLCLFCFTKQPLTNEITIVDVGQGDSIFIRDQKGKTILIDVGGKVNFKAQEKWRKKVLDTNADRTLIPYLKSRGVGKIDQLVLTHTDTDHVGDLESVADAFTIGEILVSPGALGKVDFARRLQALGYPVSVVQAGDRLAIMGSSLQVLYPFSVGDGGNNDSIVLYGELLSKRFLFTGDLEDGELDLIKAYPSLDIDVLKAGHHGSKGSSYPEFLAQVTPEIALISAGKNNRYKHPHQETLERFEKAKIRVYRTDQQGAIRFRGRKSWTIETVR